MFQVSGLGADDAGLMRGRSTDVKEELHAIRSRRSLHHPWVRRILSSAG